MLPLFSRQEKGRGKVWMMWRIRVHFGLKAESGMPIVDRAALASYAIQIIACIELHSRQGCRCGHYSARLGLPYFSKRFERRIFFVYDKAEIKTIICIPDFLPDRFHRPEIQRSAINRSNCACRDQFAVHGKIHA
jgi:hypothetical protein